jgi:hypothetical protein
MNGSFSFDEIGLPLFEQTKNERSKKMKEKSGIFLETKKT